MCHAKRASRRAQNAARGSPEMTAAPAQPALETRTSRNLATRRVSLCPQEPASPRTKLSTVATQDTVSTRRGGEHY